MKSKGLIIGVLLIIGIFLMSPVSATKIIDKGHTTFYSEKNNCYAYYSWETHKISKQYIVLYVNAYYQNGRTHKVKMVLQNIKPKKIKMTTYTNVNGKKTKKVQRFKSYGYSALWFYSLIRYDIHNPGTS